MRVLRLLVLFVFGVVSGFLLVPQGVPDDMRVLDGVANVSDSAGGAQEDNKPLLFSTTIPKDAKAASLVRVVDGDTVSVLLDGREETIRLIGINAPESVDPRRPVECMGREASVYLRTLIPMSATLYIVGDTTQDFRDKYGRLLGYLFLEDGEFINKRMIEEGYAYEYTYKTAYVYQSDFKAAEAHAQSKKIGLWSDTACASSTQKESVVTDVGSEQSPHSTNVVCNRNAYNCSHFSTRAEAQRVLEQCGTETDIHNLDVDGDGAACESLK